MKKLFVLVFGFSALNLAVAKSEPTQEYVCTIDRSEEALGGDFLNVGFTITFNPESHLLKFRLPNGNSASGVASEYFQAKWNRTNFSITALGVNYILAFENDKTWASRGGDPVPCIRKR